MFDWNDLRFFLAVARTGSTLAAGRSLAVDPTTVARRIGELERATGIKVFDKGQRGYALTEAGAGLVAAAERVEAEAEAFAAHAASLGRRVSGVIRVTTNEGLANTVLAPALAAFHRLHPDVRVDLVVDERRLDLLRGAADVALRTGPRPTEPGLVARRLASTGWAVYCSRAYADAYGPPCCLDQLPGHKVIAAEGAIAALPGWRWLRDTLPDAVVVARCSSVTTLISAVRGGLGLTVLPCFMGDGEPALMRCMGPIDGVQSDVWLITREDLRDLPRIRAFLDYLAEYVASIRPLLAGERPPEGAGTADRPAEDAAAGPA